MPEPVIHFGVSGSALLRAADAMLRSLGGSQISILIAATNITADTSAQLGIADPGVEEVPITPVVARSLPTENSGPRRRMEFLLPASTVTEEATARNFASGQLLLDNCLGIVYGGDLFHVEGLVTEYFADTAYLYRVTAVE
jgi:hypothetical protein